MRADVEDNVIMPLSCTRREIAGIPGLLSSLQCQPGVMQPLADIDFTSLARVCLVGSGDSYAIALMIEHYINKHGGIPCRAIQSLEFLSLPQSYFDAHLLVVIISASGRPSPVLDALTLALTTHAQVVGVTNAPGSPFANLTSRMLFTQASKKGLPTQSSSATLFLMMALAEKILQAHTASHERTPDCFNLSALDDTQTEWQPWLAEHADVFLARRVVFLGKGVTRGLAYLASNLMSCGPQREASFFHIEEYCHALRINQASQQHLVVMFPENESDALMCAAIQHRLNSQGALSFSFAPPVDASVQRYLQKIMLLLFNLALLLAERYVAAGGKRVTFEEIK